MNDLVAFWTLFRKEMRRVFRIWKQTLLPPVITSVLYLLIFGVSLGKFIDEVNGVTYIQFIVPGLVMMAVLTNAYANTSSSFFGSKFQKSIEELLVSPISNIAAVSAFIVAGMVRGFIVGIFVLIVARFFTPLPLVHVPLMLFFMVGVALIFASLGFITAAMSKSFDDISLFPTFLITPLTYLGGIFYSIHMLPAFWQKISVFNPMVYFINGMRYGFLGISDVSVWVALVMVLFLAAFTFWLSWFLYKTGYKLKN